MREIGYQIAGKTVGLVGFGNIGRKVAQRLRGFDCRVVYYDARRADEATETALGASYVPLSELLAASDIVSLHAPLTKETARMIDAAAIATMKNGAVLINTARGELVDERALYDALASGKLRGAGLDAFDPEPPSPDNPLLKLDQVDRDAAHRRRGVRQRRERRAPRDRQHPALPARRAARAGRRRGAGRFTALKMEIPR